MTKGSKKKFRRFLIQVNSEHKTIFDLIANGLWGLRRFQAFIESFPKYNLDNELKYMYPDNDIDSVAVKKLVNCIHDKHSLKYESLTSIHEDQNPVTPFTYDLL